MRKFRLLLLATAFIAVSALSAVVYADPAASPGSMMSGEMIGHGMMGGGMMGRMSRMMAGCGAMMHGGRTHSDRPNEQWHNR